MARKLTAYRRWFRRYGRPRLESWRRELRKHPIIGSVFSIFVPLLLAPFAAPQLAGVASMLITYAFLAVVFFWFAVGVWIYVDTKQWRRIFLAVVAGGFVVIGLYVKSLRAEQDAQKQQYEDRLTKLEQSQREKKLRAHLTPANGQIPYPENCHAPDRSHVALFLGSSVFLTSKESVLKIIKINNEVLLTLRKTTDGLLISATVYDANAKELVRIENNKVVARSDERYEPQNPDVHTFQVFDDKNEMLLYVRYVNPRAIKVLGTFRYYSKVLRVTEKTIMKNEHAWLERTCVSDLRGDWAIWWN